MPPRGLVVADPRVRLLERHGLAALDEPARVVFIPSTHGRVVSQNRMQSAGGREVHVHVRLEGSSVSAEEVATIAVRKIGWEFRKSGFAVAR